MAIHNAAGRKRTMRVEVIRMSPGSTGPSLGSGIAAWISQISKKTATTGPLLNGRFTRWEGRMSQAWLEEYAAESVKHDSSW
jgi:hypothetical protein